MVTANQLIYSFYLKKNGLNTGQAQNYKIKDIVYLINEAWRRLYENNVQRADIDKRFEDNIRDLKVPNKELALDHGLNITIAKYPDNLYKRLNQSVIVAGCEDCDGNFKQIPLRIVSEDDLNDARKNPDRKADYGWEQAIATHGPDGLYIYHDGAFKVSGVFITYYRKVKGIEAPELVRCGRYVNELDRVVESNIDFEVQSTYISDKVVDVAILLSDAATNKGNKFNLELNKISSLDQIS
jgi:hypothetical protein